MKIIPETRRVH